MLSGKKSGAETLGARAAGEKDLHLTFGVSAQRKAKKEEESERGEEESYTEGVHDYISVTEGKREGKMERDLV